MDAATFRQYAHEVVNMMADYLQNIEQYPVKAQVKPGKILAQLPPNAPMQPENMAQILADFTQIIMPGITHWQHPKFFAYFPANSSYPSLLAEMLTATLAAQCMLWDTSPAAAELEERMLDWLKQLTGLPQSWHGVIYDGASTATLSALLMARERHTHFTTNANGLHQAPQFRVYTSAEAHSSVEKAAKMAGIGQKNVVKIPTDEQFRLNPIALQAAIQSDLEQQLTPLCVVATLGTTGCTAIDSLPDITPICNKFNLWLHVDAAYAGTVLLLPDYRWMIQGIEQADSYVFNPHKWMFTNFDCSAFYVKDKQTLLQTFTVLPEYLKTQWQNGVNNYADWGPQLGRRFRALKLWFVLRSYGAQQLQNTVRHHLTLARQLAQEMQQTPWIEILAPVTLNLICFRAVPPQLAGNQTALNNFNATFMANLNQTGKLYLSHTKLRGNYSLRMVTGQTRLTERHLTEAWQQIQETYAHTLAELA
ncbi:MAG TPA: pyridoxal-dependent decarboxylase [Chitinophagales bacterium]|nr:pyridoxal-dependent decarboxylase [Chitinophagales bacterium]